MPAQPTFEDESSSREKAASAQIEAIIILSRPERILNPMDNPDDYRAEMEKTKEELNSRHGSNAMQTHDLRHDAFEVDY